MHGMQNLTDDEKKTLESMTDTQKKEFFQKKMDKNLGDLSGKLGNSFDKNLSEMTNTIKQMQANTKELEKALQSISSTTNSFNDGLKSATGSLTTTTGAVNEFGNKLKTAKSKIPGL